MGEPTPLERLQGLKSAHHVAALFGVLYPQLASLIYKGEDEVRYRVFKIKKKTGGTREIAAPRKKLKAIQRKLAALLEETYIPKPSAHGFIRDRNIVSNAEKHLDKRFVFNVDIAGFFDAIHFGRVRNLFMAPPFSIPKAPAIVLAHICCFKGHLPQGAPTSPVITNLVCRRLDRDLQRLAQLHRATYTRYVDDLTFSFTCRRARLPAAIVLFSEDKAVPGLALTEIIESHKFTLNPLKTRLHGKHQRLDVTGLVVNDFVNVRRTFVRRTSSMLYAWENFGLDAAAAHRQSKYGHTFRARASAVVPKFEHVLKGRLAYLHMVRGQRDPIYLKLAKRFNKVAHGLVDPLPITEPSSAETALMDAVFVVEVLYDDGDGIHASQGTGFCLAGIGFVTAAHVISEKGAIYKQIYAYSYKDPAQRFRLEISAIDIHRDLAIGALLDASGGQHTCKSPLSPAFSLKLKDHVALVGYPAYKVGQTPYWADARVASIYGQQNVAKFEITAQIREGNSGGPVVNEALRVVGIAVEGADKGAGNNAAVQLHELYAMCEPKTESLVQTTPVQSVV